ncbi:MAG: undecaprenyl-diphosphate phosphatase [Candidatus Magasanikbacteria bacterium]|jgi:undecaprenyl-diphosphatase|nr:undecaprenyl-diphosphate phosphatase [Candidatus Magasanikbacteria bacterium]
MELLQGIILGIVQGITEFLPVSSSGHLIFLPKLFGWADQGLLFDVVVHMGTLVAVVWFFRTTLLQYIKAVFKPTQQNNLQTKMAWIIALSIIPAGIIGVLFGDSIESTLRDPSIVAYSLIFWGIMLALADKLQQGRQGKEVTAKKGFFIACAQALALIPGTSRSGITMTAGLFAGVSRKQAAEFSFLMSVPVIAAAGVMKILEAATSGVAIEHLGMLLAGAIAAALSGYAAISFLMKLVEKRGFMPFAVYRVLIGILILWLF